MVSRAVVASVLVVGTLIPATFVMSRDRMPGQQSAIVSFEHPTRVGSQILIGNYVIVHDEEKMTRGQPCTTFYRVGTRMRLLDEVVSFRCIPHERKIAPSFVTT